MKRSVLLGGGVAVAAATTAIWTSSLLPGVHAQSVVPAKVSTIFSAGAAGVTITPAMREAASMQTAFNQVARAAAPAVVTITTMEHVPTPRGGMPYQFSGPGRGNRGGDPFGDLFRQFGIPNGGGSTGGDGSDDGSDNQSIAPRGGGAVRAGLGSGFIVRDDGLILTNAHVVRGADTVTVKLSDGREFKNARVLGQDEESDVAVVKIQATNLPTVALADSEEVNVGDWAIALGNPFGLDHTVTVGVISAKGRSLPGDSVSHEYLQTDASINPGNSGGPLLDIYGRVVGINNSIYSPVSRSAGEEGGSVGIGFAVPIDTAKKIADQLVRTGTVHRARLNVAITDVSQHASAYGLDPNTKGVMVEQVMAGGPGAKAGLQPGDVITSINGKAVLKSNDLITAVSDTPNGGSVTLDVLRGGAHKTITAQPTELKTGAAAKTAAIEAAPPTPTGTLGIRYKPLSAELAQELGVDATLHGLVVTSIVEGSPAQAAGIQRGDIIERVGQTPVATSEDINSAVKSILSRQAAGDKSVALYVSHATGQGQRSEGYIIVTP